MSKVLTQEDFARAALQLSCDIPAVKAVAVVEAPNGGFDNAGLPRILFEGHKFSEFTNHRYDATHPSISARYWKVAKKYYSTGANADIRNMKEHKRLEEAAGLDREAALKSASWGKFQLMGFNYENCGFSDLQAFINAMYKDEGAQLDAFVQFLKRDRGGAMQRAIQRHAWAEFAAMYNGSGYAANGYDKKLKNAYESGAT